jgi:hypothetical protein
LIKLLRRDLMRTLLVVLTLVLVPMSLPAQFSVVASYPAEGATGVNTSAVLSFTFSAAADTTRTPFFTGEIISNVDSITGHYWSADRKTVYFRAVLKTNTVYFMVIFAAYPATPGTLQVPYGVHWTTGTSFPSNLYTVSGSVSSGTTGVSPANAIVGLSSNGLGSNGGPAFVAGGICDGSGNFIIPYVPSGGWTPLAAKDANGDGQIDPSKGDVIAVGDTVNVTNASVTGVALVFQSFPPVTYRDARDTALSVAAQILSVNRQLKRVYSYDIDSTGKGSEWEFIYMEPGLPTVTRIRIDPFGHYVDTNPPDWYSAPYAKPIPNILTAAIADTFIARVERAGGKTFRAQKPPGSTIFFNATATVGDLWYTQFYIPGLDTSKFYWAAEYSYQVQVRPDSSYLMTYKRYIGNFSTGAIISVTGVEDQARSDIPGDFSLAQNYPNPFNPSTMISFGLPVRSHVTLEVYNLIGQKVSTILDEERPAGKYSIPWATSLPSGVYFYRLGAFGTEQQTGKFFQVRKMLLLR